MLTIPAGSKIPLPGSVTNGAGALLQTGNNILTDVFTRIDNKAITIFWSPYTVGAFGFAIESQFSEDGSSGFATGLQHYKLLIGNEEDPLQ